MEIGTKIKEVRVASGLTQEQVAGELHISRQTISNWEVGVIACVLSMFLAGGM